MATSPAKPVYAGSGVPKLDTGSSVIGRAHRLPARMLLSHAACETRRIAAMNFEFFGTWVALQIPGHAARRVRSVSNCRQRAATGSRSADGGKISPLGNPADATIAGLQEKFAQPGAAPSGG